MKMTKEDIVEAVIMKLVNKGLLISVAHINPEGDWEKGYWFTEDCLKHFKEKGLDISPFRKIKTKLYAFKDNNALCLNSIN